MGTTDSVVDDEQGCNVARTARNLRVKSLFMLSNRDTFEVTEKVWFTERRWQCARGAETSWRRRNSAESGVARRARSWMWCSSVALYLALALWQHDLVEGSCGI